RGTVEHREKERMAAAKILGVTFRDTLGLHDAHLRDTDDARRKAVAAIRKYQPDFVFTHYNVTRHPDHRVTHEIVTAASFLGGVGGFSTAADKPGKPVPDSQRHRPKKLIFFREWYDVPPSFIVDISDVIDIKLNAIAAFESQVDPNFPAPPTVLSDVNFRDRLLASSRYYGTLIGVQHGEAFFTYGIIGADDPLRLLSKTRY
ncbi:MAG: PIG-L deacetylase family protein, partial [bacterium]